MVRVGEDGLSFCRVLEKFGVSRLFCGQNRNANTSADRM